MKIFTKRSKPSKQVELGNVAPARLKTLGIEFEEVKGAMYQLKRPMEGPKVHKYAATVAGAFGVTTVVREVNGDYGKREDTLYQITIGNDPDSKDAWRVKQNKDFDRFKAILEAVKGKPLNS